MSGKQFGTTIDYF